MEFVENVFELRLTVCFSIARARIFHGDGLLWPAYGSLLPLASRGSGDGCSRLVGDGRHRNHRQGNGKDEGFTNCRRRHAYPLAGNVEQILWVALRR